MRCCKGAVMQPSLYSSESSRNVYLQFSSEGHEVDSGLLSQSEAREQSFDVQLSFH